MATSSPKYSLSGQDWLKGLLMAIVAPVLEILANFSTANFNINWTEIWHMAVASGAAYLLKNYFSGPTPPTGGGINSAAVKTMMVLIFLLVSTVLTAQSMLHPLPPYKAPIARNRFNRAIIGPTDSLPSISVAHWQGVRIGGPDIAVAIPDFSIYTGVGLDYVWALANAKTQRWDYNTTVGFRVRGGANLPSPGTVQAIGALGLRVSFFKGLLALEGLYNLTMKRKQAAFGNPAAFIPGLN